MQSANDNDALVPEVATPSDHEPSYVMPGAFEPPQLAAILQPSPSPPTSLRPHSVTSTSSDSEAESGEVTPLEPPILPRASVVIDSLDDLDSTEPIPKGEVNIYRVYAENQISSLQSRLFNQASKTEKYEKAYARKKLRLKEVREQLREARAGLPVTARDDKMDLDPSSSQQPAEPKRQRAAPNLPSLRSASYATDAGQGSADSDSTIHPPEPGDAEKPVGWKFLYTTTRDRVAELNVKALLSRVQTCLMVENYARAERIAQEAWDGADELDCEALVGKTSFWKAVVRWKQGRDAEALECLQEARKAEGIYIEGKWAAELEEIIVEKVNRSSQPYAGAGW